MDFFLKTVYTLLVYSHIKDIQLKFEKAWRVIIIYIYINTLINGLVNAIWTCKPYIFLNLEYFIAIVTCYINSRLQFILCNFIKIESVWCGNLFLYLVILSFGVQPSLQWRWSLYLITQYCYTLEKLTCFSVAITKQLLVSR